MQAKLFVLVREVFGKYHKLQSVIAKKCRELLDREYEDAQNMVKHFFEMEGTDWVVIIIIDIVTISLDCVPYFLFDTLCKMLR